MDVTCDLCGLPTETPTLGEGNRYLCEECVAVCASCGGEGTVGKSRCLNCSGTGKEPKYDPDADIFGGD